MSRFSAALALASLLFPACQSMQAPCPDTQAVVDRIAGANADLLRLSVHATPPAGGDMVAVASTDSARLGTKSAPEDHRAIAEGKTIVLDENGAVDVTVPILEKDGAYTAAAGVTMKSTGNREAVVAAAEAVARQVEAAMKK